MTVRKLINELLNGCDLDSEIFIINLESDNPCYFDVVETVSSGVAKEIGKPKKLITVLRTQSDDGHNYYTPVKNGEKGTHKIGDTPVGKRAYAKRATSSHKYSNCVIGSPLYKQREELGIPKKVEADDVDMDRYIVSFTDGGYDIIEAVSKQDAMFKADVERDIESCSEYDEYKNNLLMEVK